MEININYNCNIEMQNGKIPKKEYKNKNKEKLMRHAHRLLICSFHSRTSENTGHLAIVRFDVGLREEGKGKVILRCVLENRRAVCSSAGTKGRVGNELSF